MIMTGAYISMYIKVDDYDKYIRGDGVVGYAKHVEPSTYQKHEVNLIVPTEDVINARYTEESGQVIYIVKRRKDNNW
ncbi:hypothetical protein 015DV004_259 [Bacillus phage 015DV004]|nr:hypothetical protein 015DV004_259 [Bacillus phage 015DV004]